MAGHIFWVFQFQSQWSHEHIDMSAIVQRPQYTEKNPNQQNILPAQKIHHLQGILSYVPVITLLNQTEMVNTIHTHTYAYIYTLWVFLPLRKEITSPRADSPDDWLSVYYEMNYISLLLLTFFT